jgi:hypothetical protein
LTFTQTFYFYVKMHTPTAKLHIVLLMTNLMAGFEHTYWTVAMPLGCDTPPGLPDFSLYNIPNGKNIPNTKST